MVIMRVWTLAHTSPLLSSCYFAPFCRKFCWVGVEFLSSGAQGLFSPKKKTKHPKLDHVFLATCSSSIFSSGFCFTKKTNASIANVSQRFVGMGPANFTSQVEPTTTCKKSRPSAQNGRPHQKVHWWKPFLLEMDIPILGRFLMFRILVNIFYMWGICMIYMIHLDM